MTMFRSKSSATLRRMLRISSSGKSTESVSCPDVSLLLVAADPPLSFMDTSEAWAGAAPVSEGGGGTAGLACARPGDAVASIADMAVRSKRRILMVIFLVVLTG